jgi:tetratricopeptide (TPR) repeat protein
MSDEKYRAILERDPTDTQAFVALCNSAERNNDYLYLVQLYDFRAQVIADTKEIADLQFKAGEIYLDKLDDVTNGVQALLKGFDADKTHAGIGDRLDAVYREAGDWESAVQIAEQRLDALTRADSNGTKTVIRSDLHQQAGEIWEKVYGDKNKALSHYKKAIELDKTNLLALYGAREIYYETGKFKNAAKLCELEARCEKDPDRRAALYRELAHIFSKKLLDSDQAVVALKRSLKFAPKSAEIKMDLSEAIAATELNEENEKDHRWAAEFLLRSAASSDGDEAIALASLAIRALPTDSRGMDFIESKATSAPALTNVAAIYEEIIGQVRNPAMREPVIRRLARFYDEKLDDKETAATWLGKVGAAATARAAEGGDPFEFMAATTQVSGAPEPFGMEERSSRKEPAALPGERSVASVGVPIRDPGMSDDQFLEVLRKAADRARRSGDDATAEECLLDVLDLEPHDQKATTYLERRFRARSDWLSLRDLLLRSAGAPHLPQAVQTVRLREAARLSEEQLQDALGAIDAWQTIKENDPKVRDATDALIRLYDQAERWDELLALLTQEIEMTKSRTKKVEALRKLANIYYLRLQNFEAASDAFNSVLKLAPDDAEAVEALDDIYLKNGNYEELVALLRQRAELAQKREEKRDHLFKAAVVLRDNLERLEDAYALGKEILTLARDDQEVVDFLVSIDEAEEQWQRLLGLLEIRARFSGSTEERVELIRKRAVVALEKVNDNRAAIKAFSEILAVSPNDIPAMTALEKIYRGTGDWSSLVDALKIHISATTDKAGLVELHREMARVLEHELKREEEAMTSWHAVLEIEADAESLGALARFYERNKSWSEFVDVIEQQAAVAETHQERAEILFKRAEIIDRELGDRDRAKGELERILKEVDPTHDGALNLLTDILVEQQNFEQAADLLDQRISYAKDKDVAKKLLIQLGNWSRQELDDGERAMEAFEKAVGLDRDDEEALDLLDEVYGELKEWEKLLKLIYARAKSKSDDNERLDLLVRGAKICEEELGDNKKAWTWYVEMLDNLSHLPETIDIVETSARRMALWKELIDLAGVMTRTAQLESDQVMWWLKAADILEEKMNDPGQALEAVLRAFGLDPDNQELLDRVDRLAVVVENWQRLSTVYGVLINRAAEKEDKVALLTRYANVLKNDAKRPSDAFDISVKAFEIDPNSDELLGMVEEMGHSAERWDDLIRIYGVCASLTDVLDKKVDLKMREAKVYRDNKADPDSALLSFIKTVQFDPFDEGVKYRVWEEVRNLENDLIDSEKGTYWQKLIEGYRILSEGFKNQPKKQIDILLCVSEVHLSELNDISAAFECMKEIQELDPKDESAIDKLEEIAAKNDYWEQLAGHYQDILDETFEMDVAIMLHRRRARILEEELNRGDDAAEHYWQIIQLDSQDSNAYAKLVSYYEKAEKWNELVNMLERQLDNTEGDDARKMILFRIASVWENEIGNRYEAKDWYEQILTIWPDDEDAKERLEQIGDGKSAAGPELSLESDDDDIDALISLPPPMMDDESTAEAESDTGEGGSESAEHPPEDGVATEADEASEEASAPEEGGAAWDEAYSLDDDDSTEDSKPTEGLSIGDFEPLEDSQLFVDADPGPEADNESAIDREDSFADLFDNELEEPSRDALPAEETAVPEAAAGEDEEAETEIVDELEIDGDLLLEDDELVMEDDELMIDADELMREDDAGVEKDRTE